MLKQRSVMDKIIGLVLVTITIGMGFSYLAPGVKAQVIGTNSLVSSTFLGSGAGSGAVTALNESNQSAGYHVLSWVVTGSVSSCTVQLETSSTLTGSYTLMTSSAAQTCTSSGTYVVQAQVANFVRMNVTAFTSTSGSVSFTLVSTPGLATTVPLGVGAPVVAAAQGGLPVYSAAGSQNTNATLHAVVGTCTLGTNCTVTLTGAAAFTSATSYGCGCSDFTSAAACKIVQAAGSLTITGTGTDVIQYNCIGN